MSMLPSRISLRCPSDAITLDDPVRLLMQPKWRTGWSGRMWVRKQEGWVQCPMGTRKVAMTSLTGRTYRHNPLHSSYQMWAGSVVMQR